MRTAFWPVVAAAVLAAAPVRAEPLDEVQSAFRAFEALNETLAAEQGCECRAFQAQEDMARYADGPLAHALDAALGEICERANGPMLDALFGVTLATADASADTFTEPLARAFACQPGLVGQAVATSNGDRRATLLDLLSVGIENTADADALRARLQSFAPRD